MRQRRVIIRRKPKPSPKRAKVFKPKLIGMPNPFSKKGKKRPSGVFLRKAKKHGMENPFAKSGRRDH